MLQIVGSCDQRVFGLTPAERLRRQRGDHSGPTLVASAAAVLGDPAVAWLLENPGTMLVSRTGRPVAIAVDDAQHDAAASAIESGDCGLNALDPEALGDLFIRKLRRRDRLFVRRLDETPVGRVESELFRCVYKGITDVVTKFVWPLPAYWVTWLCARFHLHPNVVTITGMVAMVAATVLWARGELVGGLLLAWLMTFLDTVDGKLARATVTSSALGNRLDHVTDLIHPPVWWLALAFGLTQSAGSGSAALVWPACFVLLGGYVAGRAIEIVFKKRFGYNCYLWRPFDSTFRLVTARRNTILLIITIGLVFDAPVGAFVAAAAWTLASAVIQLVRLAQAMRAGRRGPLASWLM